MATRKRPNAAAHESENDWAFIEEGAIETRKDCVVYRKPTYSEILTGTIATETSEGNESDPEFEILAGFEFRKEPTAEELEYPTLPSLERSREECNRGDDAIDDTYDADDGIMIISNHFRVHDLHDPQIRDHNTRPVSSSSIEVDTTRSDSCVSLTGWDAVIGIANSVDCTSSRNDVEDIKDDDIQSEDYLREFRVLPFFSEETIPSGEGCSLGDLPANSNSSSKPDKHENDNLNLLKVLPCYDFHIKEDLLPTLENKVDNFSHSNRNKSIAADPFKALLTINGQKELVALTVSGSFRTIPCNDLSSDDESSIELINHSSESFIATDDANHSLQQSTNVVNDDDDKHLSGWMELPFMTSSGGLSFSDDVAGIEHAVTRDMHDASLVRNAALEPVDDGSPIEFLTRSLSSTTSTQYEDDNGFVISGYSKDDNCTDSDGGDDIDHRISRNDGTDSDDESIFFPRWLEDATENEDEPFDKDPENQTSHVYVDIPTFVILLCLTTALGFSIGHGLSVYLGNQAISKLKLDRPSGIIHPDPHSNPSVTAEQKAGIELWKIEDNHFQKTEDQDASKFDLGAIHSQLVERFQHLVRNHKNVKQRLHISKMMSWYWRLKCDQWRRRNHTNLEDTAHSQIERRKGLDTTSRTGLVRSFKDIYKRQYSKARSYSQRPLKTDASPVSVFTKYKIVSSIIPPRRIGWNNFKMRWSKSTRGEEKRYCNALKEKSLFELQPRHMMENRKKYYKRLKESKRCKQKIKSINGTLDFKKPPHRQHVVPQSKGIYKASFTLNGDPLKYYTIEKRPHFLKPCFDKVTLEIFKRAAPKRHQMSSALIRPNKGETVRTSSQSHAESRKGKELKLIKQVNDLKSIVAELDKERRVAEKRQYDLERHWRLLNRRQAEFENMRRSLDNNFKKKTRKIMEYLEREKKKMKNWKRDEEILQYVNLSNIRKEVELERSCFEKERNKEIVKMRKDFKLRKRSLREDKKKLKKLNNAFRKERRKMMKVRERNEKERNKEIVKMRKDFKLRKRSLKEEKKKLKKLNNAFRKERRKMMKVRERNEKERNREIVKMRKDFKLRKRSLREEKKRLKKLNNAFRKERRKMMKVRERNEKERNKEIVKMRKDFKLRKRSLKEEKKKLKKLNHAFRKERRKMMKVRERKRKVVDLLNDRLNDLGKKTMRLKQKHTRIRYSSLPGRGKEGESNRRRPRTKTDILVSPDRKKRKSEQRMFWNDLEQKLAEWSHDTDTIISFHTNMHQQWNRTQIDSRMWQEKLKMLVFRRWRAMKKYQDAERKRKNIKIYKKRPWEYEVFKEIVAKQRRGSKVLPRKGENSGKASTVPVDDSPKLLRKRRRKQKRKYERELERLDQWALQMRERKLEHDRMYAEKRKRSRKCPRAKAKYKEQKHDRKGRKRCSREKTEVIRISSSVKVELMELQKVQKSADKVASTTRGKKVKEGGIQLSDEGGTVFLTQTKDKFKDQHRKTTFKAGASDQNRPIPPTLKQGLIPVLEFFFIDGSEDRPDKSPATPQYTYCTSSPKMTMQLHPPPDSAKHEQGATWDVHRAVERDMLRKLNPLTTWFPPHFLKSDGSWLFSRASDREEQRAYPAWQVRRPYRKWVRNRQLLQKDGRWFFNRAHDRSEQRYNSEPWYMRRAAGRESDRNNNADNWWLERGYYRDNMHSTRYAHDDAVRFPWRPRH